MTIASVKEKLLINMSPLKQVQFCKSWKKGCSKQTTRNCLSNEEIRCI